MPQEHEMTVDFDTATDSLVSPYLFASLCPSRNSFDFGTPFFKNSFPILNFPPELVMKIVALLPRVDQKAFSLASRYTRAVTLSFLFGALNIGRSLIAWNGLIDAAQDIKDIVK